MVCVSSFMLMTHNFISYLCLVNALERVEECVKEIKAWMVANKLQLNEDNIQIVLVTAPRLILGSSIFKTMTISLFVPGILVGILFV